MTYLHVYFKWSGVLISCSVIDAFLITCQTVRKLRSYPHPKLPSSGKSETRFLPAFVFSFTRTYLRLEFFHQGVI